MWDTITEWVERHLGQPVRVSMTPAEPTGAMSADMVVSGPLGYSDAEWTLIDPAPGRSLACRIGDTHLLILEGAVEDVEREEEFLAIELAGASLTLAAAG